MRTQKKFVRLVMLAVLLCSQTAFAVTDNKIYEDSLSGDWSTYGDGSVTITLNSTTERKDGLYAIEVNPTETYTSACFEWDDTDYPQIVGQDSLMFWVHGGATGGQDLQVYYSDDSTDPLMTTPVDLNDYLTGGALPSDWQLVKIPLKSFSNGSIPDQIGGFCIKNPDSTEFYLDVIQLSRQNVSDPYTAYTEGLSYDWNGYCTYCVSMETLEDDWKYTGDYSMSATFNSGDWGNFVLYPGTAYSDMSNKYMLSLAISAGDDFLYGSGFWIRLWDTNQGWLDPVQFSTYIGGPGFIPSNSWYRMDIPLSALYKQSGSPAVTAATASIGGILIQNNTAVTLYTDDIRFTGYHFPLLGRTTSYNAGDGSDEEGERGRTPYNSRVVALFDNDKEESNQMEAYTGETGTAPSCLVQGITGYKKSPVSPFRVPLIAYDDEVDDTVNECAFYNEHRGYDYAAPVEHGDPFYATESGTLCIASNNTYDGSNPYRNTTQCPSIHTADSNSWNNYHAFFIDHSDGNSTWYLHAGRKSSCGTAANGLESSIWSDLISQGYAEVTRGQVIGYVGDYGACGAVHLHFGVRDGATLIDPYGSDLW